VYVKTIKMGQCNYCTLEQIKEQAKQTNMVVSTRESDGPAIDGVKGIEVYLHPPTIDIEKLDGHAREQWWVSWLMEIGTECECDD
jgi:hypothetical protein